MSEVKEVRSEASTREDVKKSSTTHPLIIVVVEDMNIYDDEVARMVDGFQYLPVDYRLLFVGKNHKKYATLQNAYEVKLEEVEKYFTFSSMALFVSKYPSKSLIRKSLEKKVVPIAHESTHTLRNYEGPDEEGNAFLFSDFTSFSMYGAVVRALENFKFPYDWNNIVKAGKKAL